MPHRRRQGRTAADRSAQASAEKVEDIARHQFFQQRPEQCIDQRRTIGAIGQTIPAAKAAPADLLREAKQALFERAGLPQLFLQLGIEAFINARYRHQHSGPGGFQIFRDQRRRPGIHHAAAGSHRQVITDGALKGMRQGQERQEYVILVGLHAGQHCLDIAEDVFVREHHALGLAGGAGGIDDGGKIFRTSNRFLLPRASRSCRQPGAFSGHGHAR